jgi:hypothetical protein
MTLTRFTGAISTFFLELFRGCGNAAAKLNQPLAGSFPISCAYPRDG